MKVISKQNTYFLISSVIMFLPRRWFILGIQSYRLGILLILLLLLMQLKQIIINKCFFNIITYSYVFYVAGYYFIDNGLMSCIGFVVDTLGVFIIVYLSISDKKDFDMFVTIFLKCLVFYCLLCIIQTLTEINIFDIISRAKPDVASTSVYYRFGLVRSYGSFTTSINNGLFLVMASCLVLWKLEYCNSKKEENRYIIYYIIVSLAICSTMSRALILILILSFSCYLIKKGVFKFFLKHILKILSIFIMVIMLFILSPNIKNSVNMFFSMFEAIFSESASSNISDSFGVNPNGVGQRILLYQWVSEKIEGREVFGRGPKDEIVFKYKDEWQNVRKKTSIENNYLKILCYFGYTGLTLYILFTAKILIYNIKKIKWKQIDFNYIAFIIQLSYIICIFTVSSVDDMRMYFMIIAMIYVYNVKSGSNNNLQKKGVTTINEFIT